MNSRGGCCIARYGGGGGDVMSKVERIMLRYRPIAPRPDSGGSSSPPVDSVSPKSRRGKRKSVEKSSSSGGSVNSNGNNKRCNRRSNEETKNGSEIVTLPLLPQTPERKDSLTTVLTPATELRAASSWLGFGDNGRYQTAKKKSDLKTESITAKTETVTSSLLTVECVTEGEYDLGCTDEETKMNLESDTCPGFISDGSGRVIWTNESFKELVTGKEEDTCRSNMMNVWLVMKEKPMLLKQRAFTCRTRLQYTCRDKETSSMTTPCDFWRMNDGGGFAWRLDVNAALCLGR
ncbi:unnamed protein product [Cochlearia groenlandica]